MRKEGRPRRGRRSPVLQRLRGPENVLEQTGLLDRVRLGLVDHDSEVYLGPYDQAGA